MLRYFEAIFVLHKCMMKYLPSLANVYITQAVSCLVLTTGRPLLESGTSLQCPLLSARDQRLGHHAP